MGDHKKNPESSIIKFLLHKNISDPWVFSFSISSVWVVLLVSFYTCSFRVLRCVLIFKFISNMHETQEEDLLGLGQMIPYTSCHSSDSSLKLTFFNKSDAKLKFSTHLTAWPSEAGNKLRKSKIWEIFETQIPDSSSTAWRIQIASINNSRLYCSTTYWYINIRPMCLKLTWKRYSISIPFHLFQIIKPPFLRRREEMNLSRSKNCVWCLFSFLYFGNAILVVMKFDSLWKSEEEAEKYLHSGWYRA